MEVWMTKLCTMAGLFVCTLVAGLLPLRLPKQSQRGKRATDILLASSGGVLLAVCFVHLLPDVREAFETGWQMTATDAGSQPLPWCELSVCFGLLFIFGLEELVEYFVCHRRCAEAHRHEQKSEMRDDDAAQVSASTSSTTVTSFVIPEAPCLVPIHDTHGTHRPQSINSTARCSNESRPLIESSEVSRNRADVSSHIHAAVSSYGSTGGEVAASKSVSKPALKRSVSAGSTGSSIRSTLRGTTLVSALSFHSVFEGLAIGLQTSDVGVLTSFAGVALHKFLMAFCMSVQLIALGTKEMQGVVYALTFATISPVGIAIGMALTEWTPPPPLRDAVRDQGDSSFIAVDAPASSRVVAPLEGIACGTLLYVTFFEVLTKTDGKGLASLVNYAAVLAGFGLITTLNALT